MTGRKLSISLPADLAEGIAHVPVGEVSAFIADAVRRKLAGDSIRPLLPPEPRG
ncbi:hypothetical protein GCM10010435_47570 [Winogradskya consettensis]|uniref:Uncharacterized protein n=1 Tax=Winogradskya consettensis TaxID=113560 RepID=A0A919VXL9_9ACTN|nr:hypothetical protein [Actinoplanes consettensis]GIM72898.1 hypothetical protein Aco04nite_32500 [Actinoplanes consettensis]